MWLAPLDVGEPDVASLVILLAPDEQQRASHFRFDRDRRHFIVARGLLRRLLARYAGGAPAQIEFRYGPQGKPALAGRDDMQFNIAHSHGAALFAFTRGAPIGVDAEQIRPLEYEALAAGFFSPAERTTLMAMPVERRQGAFFTYWARKEAYVKALGRGLSVPLDRFDVAAPDAGARLLADRGEPDAPQQWSLHDIDAGPMLRAAVAVKKHATRICVFGTLDAGSGGAVLFPFSD